MTVQAMGYFWVGTSKLDDWTSLATGQLGLQATDRGGATRAFRMDDRKQRVIFDGGRPDGEQFFGWEVADATALATLAARLEDAGVAVQREDRAAADQRSSPRSFRSAIPRATVWRHSTAPKSPANRSAASERPEVFAPGHRAWDMPCSWCPTSTLP